MSAVKLTRRQPGADATSTFFVETDFTPQQHNRLASRRGGQPPNAGTSGRSRRRPRAGSHAQGLQARFKTDRRRSMVDQGLEKVPKHG